MKTNKIDLAKWGPAESESIEVDWPKVQRELGTDHLDWLLKQDHSKCQLIVERNDKYCKLVAEFYEDKLLTYYHLMWAK